MLGYYPMDSGIITISGKNINDYNLNGGGNNAAW